MPKRMTDTEIWDKEWFMALTPKMKCAVRFLYDKCDCAGVWSPNYTLMSMYIGEKITEQELLNIPQFERLENGRIFIPDFVKFQAGELSEKCIPHKKIIETLKKHGLYERVCIGYTKGTRTLQEKNILEEEKDKEEGGMGETEPVINNGMLVPEMLNIWKAKQPDYPVDSKTDFPALQQIASFICKQSGIPYHPRGIGTISEVVSQWQILSNFISEHSFFRRYSISQVSKNIQSIIQDQKNGRPDSNKGPVKKHDTSKPGTTLSAI